MSQQPDNMDEVMATTTDQPFRLMDLAYELRTKIFDAYLGNGWEVEEKLNRECEERRGRRGERVISYWSNLINVVTSDDQDQAKQDSRGGKYSLQGLMLTSHQICEEVKSAMVSSRSGTLKIDMYALEHEKRPRWYDSGIIKLGDRKFRYSSDLTGTRLSSLQNRLPNLKEIYAGYPSMCDDIMQFALQEIGKFPGSRPGACNDELALELQEKICMDRSLDLNEIPNGLSVTATHEQPASLWIQDGRLWKLLDSLSVTFEFSVSNSGCTITDIKVRDSKRRQIDPYDIQEHIAANATPKQRICWEVDPENSLANLELRSYWDS